MNQSKLSHNEALARDYIAAFNQCDLSAIDLLLHDDYENHSPGWDDLPTDREGVKQVLKRMHTYFGNLQFVMEDVVVAEDAVSMRSRMTGRHTESGADIDVAVMQIERIADGRIKDHWRITDDAAMASQIAGAQSKS